MYVPFLWSTSFYYFGVTRIFNWSIIAYTGLVGITEELILDSLSSDMHFNSSAGSRASIIQSFAPWRHTDTHPMGKKNRASHFRFLTKFQNQPTRTIGCQEPVSICTFLQRFIYGAQETSCGSWRLQLISNSVEGIRHLAEHTEQAAHLVLPLLPVQSAVDVLCLQLCRHHLATPV